MRGDQLARQWRVIRAIEASSNGLTVAEIVNFPSTLESLQAAGFPLYTERVDRVNRWAFVNTFKFKVPQPFALAKLKFLSLYRDLVQVLKGALFHDFIKKIRCLFSPQALFDLDQIQSVFHLGIKPYKDYAQFKGNG